MHEYEYNEADNAEQATKWTAAVICGQCYPLALSEREPGAPR